MTTKSIALPLPPSVNRIWRSRTGHNGKPSFYLDRRYETWKRACDNLILAMGKHKPKVKGRFTVCITLNEDKRRSNTDADNRGKAALDMLQRAGIIENDALADSVTIRWGYAPEGCRIDITPTAERRAA